MVGMIAFQEKKWNIIKIQNFYIIIQVSLWKHAEIISEGMEKNANHHFLNNANKKPYSLSGHHRLLLQECWEVSKCVMVGSDSQGIPQALGQPQPQGDADTGQAWWELAQVKAKQQRLSLKAALKKRGCGFLSIASHRRNAMFSYFQKFPCSLCDGEMHSEPQHVWKFEKRLSLLLRLDASAYVGMYQCWAILGWIEN